jgi:hypothetical protein
MKIHGAEGMSPIVIRDQIVRGGRFVTFEYCISFLFITIHKSSDIYFLKSDENAFFFSLRYTLFTLIFGWWGLPWGPVRTVESIVTNFAGGKNVTEEIFADVYTYKGMTVIHTAAS